MSTQTPIRHERRPCPRCGEPAFVLLDCTFCGARVCSRCAGQFKPWGDCTGETRCRDCLAGDGDFVARSAEHRERLHRMIRHRAATPRPLTEKEIARHERDYDYDPSA